MLLTHYFGFAQALRPIVDFCALHRITRIEDCSHALFVNADSAANAHGQNLVMGRIRPLWDRQPLQVFCQRRRRPAVGEFTR